MQRTRMSARGRGRSGRRGVLAAAFGVLMCATSALAQVVKPVEPYHVTVVEDGAHMKAGPAGVHYSVAVLKASTVLRVDGATDDKAPFLRVEYTPQMCVFVKADEGTAEGNTVRLTAPSRLRALNTSGGERGHWWFLLPENEVLPAGTALPLIESLLAVDGRVYGYRVPAPAGARGYVKAEATRVATPAEVEEYKQQRAAASAAAPAPAPAAATPPKASSDGAGAPTAPQPAPEQPAGAEPAAVPAEQRADPAAAQPEPPQGPPAEPEAAAGQPEATDPAAPPAEAKPATVEALQSLYQQAQSQPIREAELDEVMAEFQRTIDSLTAAEDQRTRDFLKARLELLRMRSDLQKSVRAAEELAGNAGQRTERFERDSAALDRARAYTVVGRLVPSTVYDGRRLPKMYRVQSVDEGFARTVAYLMPSDRLELDAKLGRVVGIVGETSLDPALRVNIIRPRRVDVLNPARSGEPAPAPAATPDAAPAAEPTTQEPATQGAAVDPR